jgi:selenocysteine lyase/cysteine desulfurase
VPGVTLYGPPPGQPRTATVAFTVAGRHPRAVSAALAERALFASHGDFYAATVAERLALGAGGMVRAGCACYTTADEVERLVAGVREVAGGVSGTAAGTGERRRRASGVSAAGTPCRGS